MSDIIDREFINIHTYPVKVLVRVLPVIPSCHFSKTMPSWEQEIIYHLSQTFDIPTPPPSEISYDIAIQLKGEIFRKLGDRFDQYAEIRPDKFDLLKDSIFGGDGEYETE